MEPIYKNVAVVVSYKKERSLALLNWVLGNCDLSRTAIKIIRVHLARTLIGSKARLEEKSEHIRRSVQQLCARHQVNAEVVKVISWEDLIREIREFGAEAVYMSSSSRLLWNPWSTAGYVLKHAPETCVVHVNPNSQGGDAESLSGSERYFSCKSNQLEPENGSLEGWLHHQQGVPNFLWYECIRIAVEIADALNSGPLQIANGKLKPSNIWFGRDYTCRLFDNSDDVIEFSSSDDFAYIDPEFNCCGEFNCKSHLFSFGVILLQLLSRKASSGLHRGFQKALRLGSLQELLDPAAAWSLDVAKEIAHLALRCAEPQAKDRPDLKDEVLPILNRIWSEAKRTASANSAERSIKCPLSGVVMEDPVTAEDGYTYELAAIFDWLQLNEISPMTGKKLKSKDLVRSQSLVLELSGLGSVTMHGKPLKV